MLEVCKDIGEKASRCRVALLGVAFRPRRSGTLFSDNNAIFTTDVLLLLCGANGELSDSKTIA